VAASWCARTIISRIAVPSLFSSESIITCTCQHVNTQNAISANFFGEQKAPAQCRGVSPLFFSPECRWRHTQLRSLLLPFARRLVVNGNLHVQRLRYVRWFGVNPAADLLYSVPFCLLSLVDSFPSFSVMPRNSCSPDAANTASTA